MIFSGNCFTSLCVSVRFNGLDCIPFLMLQFSRGVVVMTDLEYEILSFVKSSGDVHWVSVLNAMYPAHSYKDTGDTLKHLVSNGTVKICVPVDQPPNCSIQLSAEGGFALLEEISFRAENVRKEEDALNDQNRIVAEEQANRKKEKASDRRFQLLLAFVQAILALVVGILVEHYAGIIDLIKEFF